MYGGKLTFNTGSEDENCKTDEDGGILFQILQKISKLVEYRNV